MKLVTIFLILLILSACGKSGDLRTEVSDKPYATYQCPKGVIRTTTTYNPDGSVKQVAEETLCN